MNMAATTSSKEREELVLPMDWDIIDASNGFTFDIGGSVMKLVYVSPEDWVEPKDRKKGSQGKIRLVNFSREDLDEALQFINTKVRINRKSESDAVKVYSTGIGGAEFPQKFKEVANTNTENLPEFDCFSHSFKHMIHNTPRNELEHPLAMSAFESAIKEFEQVMKMLPKMKGKTAMTDNMDMDQLTDGVNLPQMERVWTEGELMTTEKNMFPCGIVMCGSGFGLCIAREDGSFDMADGSNRGGRMFLGLGSLLTGSESFEELISYCEKGHSDKVSVTTKSLGENIPKETPENKDEDVYRMFVGEDYAEFDPVVFCFGKSVGKKIGDFKKEDMARALLEAMILDMVHFIETTSRHKKIHHVFFCGGFVGHPLTRKLITHEWLRRNIGQSLFDPEADGYIQPHFLVHGQSLGALGAFLNHKQQWNEKMKQQATAADKPTAVEAIAEETADIKL